MYGGGPEVILHSCQRPVPPHTAIPIHSATSPNLLDQNIKFNRVDAKLKQVTVSKSTDSIAMQENSSVIENNSTTNVDGQQPLKESNG
jgi:ubiquitin carboxyl-terminal hydrolase 20/33